MRHTLINYPLAENYLIGLPLTNLIYYLNILKQSIVIKM
jgi:hypothetical protein